MLHVYVPGTEKQSMRTLAQDLLGQRQDVQLVAESVITERYVPLGSSGGRGGRVVSVGGVGVGVGVGGF